MAKENFWPDVSNLQDANKAIRYGFWAAVFVATVTAIFAFVAIFLHTPVLGIDGSALFDAVLFAGVAFGIDRKSRVAALVGLGLYVVERFYMLATSGGSIGVGGVMAIILTLYFVHGVRGTFAY